MPQLTVLALTLLALLSSVRATAAQAVPTLPDSGVLVRIHTDAEEERGRLLAPFRPDAATIRFCAYPGPACDADTPADRMLEMRTDAIRSLERSVGTHWREGAVIGGLIGAGIGLLAVGFADGMNEGQDIATGNYVGAAIVSGVIWGGIGAMFTGSSQKWEVVF